MCGAGYEMFEELDIAYAVSFADRSRVSRKSGQGYAGVISAVLLCLIP